MISAQTQTYDNLTTREQEVVKVACTFSAFTPCMVLSTIQTKIELEELERVCSLHIQMHLLSFKPSRLKEKALINCTRKERKEERKKNGRKNGKNNGKKNGRKNGRKREKNGRK